MKVIKLTESDLRQIVQKVIDEQTGPGLTSFNSDSLRFNANNILGIKPNINPKNLKLGDGGKTSPEKRNDVIELQKKLIDLGLLKIKTGKPTGFFGQLTQSAISQYNGNIKPTKKEPQTKQSQPNKGDVANSSKAKNVAKCETGTEKVLIPGASLLFDGDKLYWLTNGEVIKSWDAVSGLTWKNTPLSDWNKLLNKYVKNRQEWSQQKDAGPLPEGKYAVGPLETRAGQPEEIGALKAFWYKITGQVEDQVDKNKQFCSNTLLSRISWGNYRLKITPTGGQKMYNRGAFYVHGGSLEGSHGCIDLTDDMEDFAKFFGVWTSANNKKTIPLVVKYKNPAINQIIQKLVNLV